MNIDKFDQRHHVNKHSSICANLKNEQDPIKIAEFIAHQSLFFRHDVVFRFPVAIILKPFNKHSSNFTRENGVC